MAQDKRITARIKELNTIFEDLPQNKKILLRSTIETVAFMDIQLSDLEVIILSGEAKTPDKQLYSSTAKTREVLMKSLLKEIPAEKQESRLKKLMEE